MSDYAIELDSVTKLYSNGKGVKNITFEIPKGEVFGFLGPNGAGKSTTIRTIMDFIHPNKGAVSILGMMYHNNREEILANIGYLTSDISLYQELTGNQMFQFMKNLRGSYDQDYLDELVRVLDVQTDQRIGTLSKGNKQKISLILAVMYQPKILIMDEPTSGLDPLMKEVFYDIIAKASANGTTVLVSSHDLREVQKMCSRVAFIREGEIVDIVEVSLQPSMQLSRLELGFKKPVDMDKIKAIPAVKAIEEANEHFIITIQGNINPLLSFLSKHPVDFFATIETSLEDVFMHYYTDQQ